MNIYNVYLRFWVSRYFGKISKIGSTKQVLAQLVVVLEDIQRISSGVNFEFSHVQYFTDKILWTWKEREDKTVFKNGRNVNSVMFLILSS